MDEKIKTWPLRFPAKENPNMEKALFDWPIVLQYDVKAKYRLISRKFSGVRLTNQKPRAFVFVQIALFPFVCCFCFVRAFSFQGETKIALMGKGTYYWVWHRIHLKHQYPRGIVPLRLELPVATCAQSHANIGAAVRWVSNPGFVVTCGLRFLLVISLAPEVFSQSSPDFYSPYKQHYRIPVQFAMDPGTTVA